MVGRGSESSQVVSGRREQPEICSKVKLQIKTAGQTSFVSAFINREAKEGVVKGQRWAFFLQAELDTVAG